MNKHYESLVINNCFSEQDAKEVIDIIVQHEKVTDLENFDFSKAYDERGARWDDDELLEYVNEEYPKDEQVTIEDIFQHDIFHRLSSGLIISWNY